MRAAWCGSEPIDVLRQYIADRNGVEQVAVILCDPDAQFGKDFALVYERLHQRDFVTRCICGRR